MTNFKQYTLDEIDTHLLAMTASLNNIQRETLEYHYDGTHTCDALYLKNLNSLNKAIQKANKHIQAIQTSRYDSH